MQQVEAFSQRVDQLLVLGGILTQIHLRLAVTRVLVVLTTLQEIVARLIVVLIHDGHSQFVGQFPSVLIVRIAGMRAGTSRSHDDNLGMGLRNALIHILEALVELGRDSFLVADSQIFQSERLRVTCISTHLAPLRVHVAVGPLNQVERLVHPLVHLAHGHHILSLVFHAPAAVGSLAAHATGQNGQRLHVQVLAELEILIVAQSHTLVVAPRVLQSTALLLRSNGSLPAIGVPESVAASMNHTTAWEAHELRMQVGQSLSQILAHAMTLIGILGHQRNHVNIHLALIQHQNLQHGLLGLFRGSQHNLVFLPILAAYVDGSLGQQFRVLAPPHLRLSQHYADLFRIVVHIAEESREIIFGPGLYGNAVEAIVLQAETLPALVVVILLHALDMQAHIGGIVLVEPVVHARGQIAQRVSGTDGLPGCSRSPPVTLGRTELERAVLHQFRIESAIGSTTDILEEDTDQFVTNSLSPGRRVHGFLGRHAQSGCHHDTQNELSFHHTN